MRTLLLFIAIITYTTTGFSQSRYIIESNFSEGQSKEFMNGIETYIPNTFDRNLNANRIEFSTLQNHRLGYLDSVATLIGMNSRIITKDRAEYLLSEKVGGTDCEQAEQLCSNSSLPGNSSGFGTQELSGANRGCLAGNEHQSSWYYLNVQTGGSLSLRINPSAASDYDFAIWGPFTAATAGANCPPVSTPVRCSFAAGNGNTGIRAGEPDNSEDSFGDRWVNALTVNANEIYILLIDNFSASGVGYAVDFSWGANVSTAVLGCTPVVLPVGITEFSGLKIETENVLTWTTESEQNNDFFTLQYSSTGMENDWNTVQVIEGAGDSETKKYYSAIHSDYRQNSLNYYRLIQTDFNGKETMIEKIVAIDNRVEEKEVVKVINLVGQEVSVNEKGIVIYIFKDGTQQKRFNQ